MHSGTRVGVGYNVQIARHQAQPDRRTAGSTARSRTSVCSRRRLQRLGRTWLSTRTRSRTEATTRSKTLRTAKPLGSRPTFRSPTGARPDAVDFPKSDFQYDDATDTYRCPAGERLVPLYRRSVGKSRTGRILSVTPTAPHAEAAAYANDVPRTPIGASRASRTKQPHGEPSRRPARGDGSSPGVGRASLRFDQAVDGPRRVPDAPAPMSAGSSASPPWPTTCDAQSTS